jgi:hypothetical protein
MTNPRQREPAPRLSNDKGEPRDYIIIPVDQPHPELWKRENELTERQARKRAGVGSDNVLEVHRTNVPLYPLA